MATRKKKKTWKLCDLIDAALTEIQRIKTRKGDIKTLSKCTSMYLIF